MHFTPETANLKKTIQIAKQIDRNIDRQVHTLKIDGQKHNLQSNRYTIFRIHTYTLYFVFKHKHYISYSNINTIFRILTYTLYFVF